MRERERERESTQARKIGRIEGQYGYRKVLRTTVLDNRNWSIVDACCETPFPNSAKDKHLMCKIITINVVAPCFRESMYICFQYIVMVDY